MNDIEKAIETLRMENDLMQFDPTTGEERPIEFQNEMNQECYNAHLVAISALGEKSDKNCSRCIDRNRCAIHKNFNIDYCSDWSVEE